MKLKLSALMEVKFQDHGNIDHDLEEWLSQISIKPSHSFFYEEQKKEAKQIKKLDIEGAKISDKAPEVEISTKTMAVVKLSQKVEVLGDKIDANFSCGEYIQFLGQEQTQMQILIALLGTQRIIIGLSQGNSTIYGSRSGKVLSIIFSSNLIPLR